jgi:protein SCO1/2
MTANRLAGLSAVALVLACAAFAAAHAFFGAAPPAPDFTLTDQDGRPYTLSGQRGHAIALFFGYAHCTDICPETLADLAHAKRSLGAAGASFDVVFVTVDAARDTPAALKRYVRAFDPAFVGLTGSPAQLDPVYRAYHVYHEIDASSRTATGYDIIHSTTVQFIAPDGRLRGVGDWTDSPAMLATAMRKALT